MRSQPPTFGIVPALALMSCDDFLDFPHIVDLRTIQSRFVSAKQHLMKLLDHTAGIGLIRQGLRALKKSWRKLQIVPQVPQLRDVAETVTLQGSSQRGFLGTQKRLHQFGALFGQSLTS